MRTFTVLSAGDRLRSASVKGAHPRFHAANSVGRAHRHWNNRTRIPDTKDQ